MALAMNVKAETTSLQAVQETTYSVELVSYGANKLAVINVLKSELGLDMKGATDLLATLPCTIKEGMTEDEANTLAEKLRTAGATVNVTSSTPDEPITDPTEVTYSVELVEAGTTPMAVIKVVKEQLGIGLSDAKHLVESAPCILKEGMTEEEADALVTLLRNAGAHAIMHREIPHYPIQIFQEDITSETAADVLGDGCVSYDPETHTLYLKNFNYIDNTNAAYVIHNDAVSKPLTIHLTGNNVIMINGGVGIIGWKGFIFTGDGTLEVDCDDGNDGGTALQVDNPVDGCIEIDNVSIKLAGGEYGVRGASREIDGTTNYYTDLKLTGDNARLEVLGYTASIADIRSIDKPDNFALLSLLLDKNVAFSNGYVIGEDGSPFTEWVTIARDTRLPLKICGTQVTEENAWNLSDILKELGALNEEGRVFFDKDSNTLALVDAQLTYSNNKRAAISYGQNESVTQTLNIKVGGDCSVTNDNGVALFSSSGINFNEWEGGTLALNGNGYEAIMIDGSNPTMSGDGTFTWPLSNEATGNVTGDVFNAVASTSCTVGSGLTTTEKTYFKTYDMIAYTSPGKATDSDGTIRDTTLMESVMIEYRVTMSPGWTFKPSSVKFNVVKDGTNNGFYTWGYTADGEESALNVVSADDIRYKNDTDGPDINRSHYVRSAGYCSEFTFRIYVSGLDAGKILGISNVVIDGEFKSKAPVPTVEVNFNGPDVTATGYSGLETRGVAPQLNINDGTITFNTNSEVGQPVFFIETTEANLNLGDYYTITPADAVLTASKTLLGNDALLFTDSEGNKIRSQVVFSKSIPLWIAGIQVTEENAWNLTSLLQEAGKIDMLGGWVGYNVQAKELYLFNAQLTGTISNGKQDGSDIVAGIEDLEIMVKGDCSVNVSNDDGIITTAPITFTKNVNGDDGSLTVTGSDGILLLGDGTSTKLLTVTFSGPDVTARSDSWCAMTSWGVKRPRIVIEEGTLTLEGPDGWGYPLWLHDVTSASLVRGSGTITPSNAYFRMVTDAGVRDGVFVDRDNDNSIYRGKVVIGKQPVIPGDVNIDGDIDINDVMALVSHICGQTPTQFDYTAADANGDGEIDINDVMRVADTIVNQ